MTDDVRPERGWVDHKDGTRTEVRYIATSKPGVFLAVSIDGDPIQMKLGDTLRVDKMGAGQRIKVTMRASDGRPAPLWQWGGERPDS